MSSKNIVILGGGVIGLCSALYAARRGHRVTVVDQAGARGHGCSYGNAGMIVPSHFVPLAAPGMVALGLKWMWNPQSPFYIKPSLRPELLRWGWEFWKAATPARVAAAEPLLRDLHLRSRALFEELAAATGNDFGLEKRGLLLLCRTQHTLDEEAKAARHARELNVPAEVLDASQTAAKDPTVTMDVAGSVYFPMDCHLTPGRFMESLKRQCANLGVQFLWNTRIDGLASSSGRVQAVQTSSGDVVADEVVLALGSWSPSLARGLGLKLPMQAGKGYSLTLDTPRQLPALCSILTEARVAVTPMQGGRLRFGGTMEIAGMDERVNAPRVQGIIKSAVRYFPEFRAEDFAELEPWCGLRPCSPDGLPYLGRTARFSNLTVATGHAMMGLSLGPVSGEMVARIVDGEGMGAGADLRLLSPDRFAQGGV